MLYLYNGKLYKIEQYRFDGFPIKIFECDLNTVAGIKENINLESTAYKLKSTIAKWYMALRTIALVGLLSVLVYIGIRIILSSGSANNKAKYKNVIKNSGDLKKYHVDLYIKFAEEEEGRYYDFYSDDTIMFEHPIIIHLKNEQLGLDIEKEFVMGLDSEEEVFFLWYSDAPHNGKINDIPLLLSKN